MAASSSPFLPRKVRPTEPPGRWQALLAERKARAEDTDPEPGIEDEDDLDDRFPWVGPDFDALEGDLLEDWGDEDDPSLVPFLPDEDELDGDDDEGPGVRRLPR